jgi:hypothetical protein
MTFNRMTPREMTDSRTINNRDIGTVETISLFGTTILSLMKLSIITLSMNVLFVTLSIA